MVYSWKVSYVDVNGDKPIKGVVVLTVDGENSVEDTLGRWLDGRGDIDVVKYEKIGPTFIDRS